MGIANCALKSSVFIIILISITTKQHSMYNQNLYNQTDLFSNTSILANSWSNIEGLLYVENFITTDEQNELIQLIDNEVWLDDLKRRVQHYGYKYDYKARKIDASMQLGELPIWLENIGERLCKQGIFIEKPDQVIINEYMAGQGIAAHIDCEPCFEDTIVSLSLLSPVVMDFTHKTTDEKIPVLLQPKSIVVLKSESRYDWKHGIAARQYDKLNGQIFKRSRRISLTFRRVIL